MQLIELKYASFIGQINQAHAYSGKNAHLNTVMRNSNKLTSIIISRTKSVDPTFLITPIHAKKENNVISIT